MSKVLPFTPVDAPPKRKAGQVSAEIVIFPGVRVEYHDRPPSPAGDGQRGGGGGRQRSKGALSA